MEGQVELLVLLKLVRSFLGEPRQNYGRFICVVGSDKEARWDTSPCLFLCFNNESLTPLARVFFAPHGALDCRHDLEAIDCALVQSLTSIRDLHIGGLVTEEAFRDMGLGGFEVVTADGRRVDLPTPGGASREVTQGNRLEFADMVEAFKMREYRAPVSKTIASCLEFKVDMMARTELVVVPRARCDGCWEKRRDILVLQEGIELFWRGSVGVRVVCAV